MTDDLDTYLNTLNAPEPRAGLADDILQAARAATPANIAANDNLWNRLWSGGWKRYASVAALALFGLIAFGTVQLTTPSEADILMDAAQDTGFTDLLNWVEGQDDT